MDKASLEHAINKPYSEANPGIRIAELCAALEQFDGRNLKLIDLGCGTGWTSTFFAEAGFDVTGYELAPDAVEIANKNIPKHLKDRLRFKVGDFENIPFENEFDAALFVDALHHSEDEVMVLEQVYKVLKDKGVCITLEPGVGHSKTAKSIEAMEKYGVTERDMPPKLIKRSALKAGFTSAKFFPHPGALFGATYKSAKEATGLKRTVFNSSFLRTLLVLQRVIFERRREGMVVLRK